MAALAVALAAAKPNQIWFFIVPSLVHVWCAGGSHQTLGIEKSESGKGLSGQAGLRGSFGAFLPCEKVVVVLLASRTTEIASLSAITTVPGLHGPPGVIEDTCP